MLNKIEGAFIHAKIKKDIAVQELVDKAIAKKKEGGKEVIIEIALGAVGLVAVLVFMIWLKGTDGLSAMFKTIKTKMDALFAGTV